MGNPNPVGQGDYVVKPGDCMESIAFEQGFLWETLWNLPANGELKSERQPNVLLPGDRVTIPNLQPFEKPDCPTDQTHQFVLPGTKSKLYVRFLDDKQQPRSGLKYALMVDGQKYNGTLDGAGSLTQSIPANASQGSIQLLTDPDPESYPLNFGHLDPDESQTGVRGRLNNLGYTCSPDGGIDADLQGALIKFQTVNNLPPTGQLDDDTRQALTQEHLS
jgi:Putative peptidoglycan binding domain/LysM domain